MIPVDIHGMAVDENEENYVVVLNGKDRSEDKWLPIRINAMEAQNIAIQLNDQDLERPMSHDLLAELTERLDGSVESVELDVGDRETLRATVSVRGPDPSSRFELEAAPSDAIALALRTDAEIVVEESIMQTGSPSTDPSHPSDEVNELRRKLGEAVDNEEFERAAELRDAIRDAQRRYDESVDDLGDDVEDELQQAFEGSDTDDEESSATDEGAA